MSEPPRGDGSPVAGTPASGEAPPRPGSESPADKGGLAVGVGVGLVVGGVCGAAVRGSGSIYDNVLFVGAFVAVLLVAVVGAVVSTLHGRSAAAGRLTVFIGASIVATLAAYILAPPYRSPDAPEVADGSLTVRVTAPQELEFGGAARCRIERGATTVGVVSVSSAHAGDRDVIVLLEPGGPGAGSPAKLTLSFMSPAGHGDYRAAGQGDLTPIAATPDGRAGSFAFVADRDESPPGSADPPFERLSGTIEWACP